jgi:hypothetical protein
MEQKANIKFCFKMGKTATETSQLIKQAYDDSALSRTWVFLMVFEWFKRFKDGHEDLQDDPRNRTPNANS